MGRTPERGLTGIRVLDFSEQVAGPYCSKLFVDGGAEVVKVEPPQGDSLRHWSATGADLRGEDSALFRFLKDLAAGTLSDERLAFYFEQNTHYINNVVKCRSIATAKAHNNANPSNRFGCPPQRSRTQRLPGL